jgi:hypothetical protein
LNKSIINEIDMRLFEGNNLSVIQDIRKYRTPFLVALSMSTAIRLLPLCSTPRPACSVAHGPAERHGQNR